MNKLVNWIASWPRFRLAVTLVGGLFPGIFGNIYAAQIAPNGTINWSSLASVSSFWPLLISFLLWLILNIGFLGYDEDIARFADDAHCFAYVRKTRLEAYARVVKDDPAQAALIDAKALLKELNIQKP